MGGFCLHTPGAPGRGAVLDIGQRCPHDCLFCYYKEFDGEKAVPRKAAPFRDTEELRLILDLVRGHGFDHFDITGGEPALHPDIVPLVAHGCRDLGLAGRLITLGQFLLRERSGQGRLVDRLLAAGLSDCLFSLHGPDETSFRHITGGSLATLRQAMDHLDGLGFQYGANTVVFEGNRDRLEEIASVSLAHGVYIHNFIMFNAYHGWDDAGRIAGYQARYADALPGLSRAVAALTATGVAVNIRYAPYCLLPGLERHVVGLRGVFYDPFEWRNRACSYDKSPEYCAAPLDIDTSFALVRQKGVLPGGARYMATRGDLLKVFPESCAGCAAMEVCDGFAPSYLALYGADEVRPYARFDAVGALPRARLDYAAPYYVKTAQFTDMRAVIKAATVTP